MGLQIRRIKVKDVRDSPDFQELAQQHATEIRGDLGYSIVNLQWDMYSELEFQDHLFGLGVFTPEGKIVGYAVCIVSDHLHYKDTKFCICDAIYLQPEFRSHGNGSRLVRETERTAKELGCALMNFHAKPCTPFHGLLTHRKYFERDVILERNL